ncbi:MAG: hypothetical protein CFE23_16440 [Flavobacterium sp. BFFFF1]|uniref:DUF5687 family protein n=1 Tax=Flavobacterium sp. BFFFF1 TaxID=2015557 RepID=UPI000BC48643|nr:DUF5687 family protein [Flavobacterium sp. BFFFF1]OYU78912.1 MAG: hypothetical protein CFE23_16440 [Flavobacterium sp. BFFFF1]
MIGKFLYLEWKSFFRSASFATNVILKIFMGIMALYMIAMFLLVGIGGFELMQSQGLDPLKTVNKILIYYFIFDLVIRLLLQKIPVLNIRPMLVLPIKRPVIVNFAIGKTMLSFFNLIHAFLFLPFTIVLIKNGYDATQSLLWLLSLACMFYINNLLNIILNNKDNLFILFLVLAAGFAAMQYYGLFDITVYTSVYFNGLFGMQWMVAVPLVAFVVLYVVTHKYLMKNLYLDAGLAAKHAVAKTEQFDWLNQFGTVGTFLKNDIRLIKRNKRSKSTVLMSVLFLFYGLLFFSGGIEAYNNPAMHMFAGIFVTGGFLFTFGQFVPSWDSSYYPLMMTQNIPYKGYLNAKWWLIVIATAVSTILASFYLYFGLHIYLMIVVGAIYNMGFNSHLVLLGGAFTKTPVDLASSRGAFGDKKAFNLKTMLISLPKLLLPMLLYLAGSKIYNPNLGLVFVAAAGVLGFAFRDKVFSMIEKIYKSEKYATLDAYKQKN